MATPFDDRTIPRSRLPRPPHGRPASLRLAASLLALAVAGGCKRTAVEASDADWADYLGGPARDHYSSLRQITTANVGRLRRAWEYHTGDLGEMQCNPLVVDGILYGLTAANGVFALDAATGRERWRYAPAGPKANRILRGLTFWRDGPERRILFTHGEWLCALDASTGRPIASFGNGGRTSLKAGLGAQAGDKWVISTTPGALYEDLLIVPTRVTEGPDAAPGFIQAFNVRTGRLVWTFRTIPAPGEFGHDTWSKDAYENVNVGSANCWAGMTVDRARGIVYIPTGSAAPDFWGGNRKGSDLFANCLLALDARTGRLRWYFQAVHHDLWDRDLPAPPALVTVRHDGQWVDAVAQTTKSGYVLLFDRVTGRPLFPIREVPVPKSGMPGEETAPTQPVPEWPEPFARQTITPDDVSPYAENRAELRAEIERARRGAFQPFGRDDTLLFPGFDGGAEWGGPAVDPDGILYVNANEMAWVARLKDAVRPNAAGALSPGRRLYATYCVTCHGPERRGNPASGIPSLVDLGRRKARDEVARLIAAGKDRMPGFPMVTDAQRQVLVDFLFGTEKVGGEAGTTAAPPPDADRNYAPYELDGYVKFLDRKGYAAIRPPWGSLTAINLNTGARVWQVTLGNFKELSPAGNPPTGTENYGGPVATAGGLLFIAATKDGMFRAFDKATGRQLWESDLPAGGFATPCTYLAGGRQYVVVACGGTKLGTKPGDSYVAFALP